MFGRGRRPEHVPRYYPHHLVPPVGHIRVRIHMFGELYVIDWEGNDVEQVAVEFAQFLEDQSVDGIPNLPAGWRVLPHVHKDESGLTAIRTGMVVGFEVIEDGR